MVSPKRRDGRHYLTPPRRITYTAQTANYVSAGSFLPGTTCSGAGGGGAIDPNPQTGPPSIYSAVLAQPGQGGTWFPGTPCLVTVDGLGCYLAWANATTYMEEGNYALSGLNYLPGCPNCARAPPAVADGMCSSDGSLSCAGGDVNYRGVAVPLGLGMPAPGGTARSAVLSASAVVAASAVALAAAAAAVV